MRILEDWRNLELFLREVRLAFVNGDAVIEIWKIDVRLNNGPSLENCPDDRVPGKNSFEYHKREELAHAYAAESKYDLSALEWEACARERAENCVCGSGSIDRGHLRAIEYCVQQAISAWGTFSGRFVLPSLDQAG